MIESYYIGAYWGARGEAVSACAQRLVSMLTELRDFHALLGSWKEKAHSLRNALKRNTELRGEALEPLFDVFDPGDPNGYLLDIWNGQRNAAKQASIMITCGMAPKHSGLCNFVVLDLPDPTDANATLYAPDVLLSALRTIVRAWDPDWCVVMNRVYRDEIADPDNTMPEGKPDVGWMTYLRNKRLGGLRDGGGTLPCDVPCEIEEVPGHGSIFVVTRDHRFSVENPGDLERIQALTAYLEAHGALEPIPTNQPH